MQKQNQLPFLIETNAINEWLDAIALKQPVQATNEIYNALKIIIKQQNEYYKDLTCLLPLLTPVIIQLCQHLEQLFCTSEKNIDEKMRKISRLSISTLRYLAILYQHLGPGCDDNTLLAQYYNNCLQISYLCLKQSALTYERPSSELWKIIGKIYQSASEKGILDLELNDCRTSYKKQTCITENIKIILLFSLCKPYQLKQLDIIHLSDLIAQHNDKLILTNQLSTNCSHSWNYNSSQAVQTITPDIDICFSTLFLDCHLLIPRLIAANLSAIAAMLTVSQSVIPLLKQAQPLNNKKISTGFDAVKSIIEQLKQNEKINKTSVQALSVTDRFELQPFDYEHSIKDVPAENTLQHENKPCLIVEAIVKEKADLDFVLIESASFPCNSEDLIIILDDETPPQLGIIRSITPLKNNHYQLLTEKISSEVDIAPLTNQKSENKALLCKTSDSSTSLLVTTHNYTTGSNIQIAKQSFSLTRLLEITAYFMLYQIQTH